MGPVRPRKGSCSDGHVRKWEPGRVGWSSVMVDVFGPGRYRGEQVMARMGV